MHGQLSDSVMVTKSGYNSEYTRAILPSNHAGSPDVHIFNSETMSIPVSAYINLSIIIMYL